MIASAVFLWRRAAALGMGLVADVDDAVQGRDISLRDGVVDYRLAVSGRGIGHAPYVNPSRLPDCGQRCRKEAMAFAHDRATFSAVMGITELPAR